MTRYKLYVLRPTEYEVDELVKKFKYVLVNPTYILVYTPKRKPTGGILVERPEVLTVREKAWVMSCNMQIEEELFKRSEYAAKAMQSFLHDLEAELKAEQEALKKEA